MLNVVKTRYNRDLILGKYYYQNLKADSVFFAAFDMKLLLS